MTLAIAVTLVVAAGFLTLTASGRRLLAACVSAKWHYLLRGTVSLWYRIVGLVFISIGRRRSLWAPIEKEMKIATTWQQELKIIQKYVLRYQAAPYRHKHSNSIEEENIPLCIADAAAYYYFFKTNLPSFRYHVAQMVNYL